MDSETNAKLYNLLFLLTMVMPILLPALPVLISCAVSVRYVWRRTNNLCEMPKKLGDIPGMLNGRLKHRATVTIVIITFVYIVFNIPYWTFLLYMLIFPSSGNSLFKTYLFMFLNPVSVILNGFINPIVYYLRIAGMKKQLNGDFRNLQFPKSPALSRRKLTPKPVMTPINVRNVITLNNLHAPLCNGEPMIGYASSKSSIVMGEGCNTDSQSVTNQTMS